MTKTQWLHKPAMIALLSLIISCDPETFLTYGALPNKIERSKSIYFPKFWFFYVFYSSEFVYYNYFLLISLYWIIVVYKNELTVSTYSFSYWQTFCIWPWLYLFTHFCLSFLYFVPYQLGDTYWLTDISYLLMALLVAFILTEVHTYCSLFTFLPTYWLTDLHTDISYLLTYLLVAFILT